MNFLELFVFFWAISIIGWIMEVIVCSIEVRHFVNRGFLIGPYCPIYGFGGLILLSLFPLSDKIIFVFCLSIILCSLLEYITSYLMELVFKVRWWDYSKEPFNINGRICLRNSLAFGVLGTLLVCVINPLVYGNLDGLSNDVLLIVSIIIFIVTFTDIILSFKIMQNIKGSIAKMSTDKSLLRDATDDIKKAIRNALPKKTYLYRRFLDSYDKFELYRNGFVEKIKGYRTLLYNKRVSLEIFLITGLVVGIIAGFITGHFTYSLFICLAIGIMLNLLYDKFKGDRDERK